MRRQQQLVAPGAHLNPLHSARRELMSRFAIFSFGLFLYQKSEFLQMLIYLRVKTYLLQNVGARFHKM